MKTITTSLGWCVGKFVYNEAGNYGSLTIASPSASEENSFHPAESVDIYGRESIQSLRDFCDAALNTFEEREQKKP